MGKLTNRGRADIYDEYDARKLGEPIKPVEVSKATFFDRLWSVVSGVEMWFGLVMDIF